MKIYIAGTTPGTIEGMKREDKLMRNTIKIKRLLTFYEVKGGKSEQWRTFKFIAKENRAGR